MISAFFWKMSTMMTFGGLKAILVAGAFGGAAILLAYVSYTMTSGVAAKTELRVLANAAELQQEKTAKHLAMVKAAQEADAEAFEQMRDARDERHARVKEIEEELRRLRAKLSDKFCPLDCIIPPSLLLPKIP